jgi:hypothetical protein
MADQIMTKIPVGSVKITHMGDRNELLYFYRIIFINTSELLRFSLHAQLATGDTDGCGLFTWTLWSRLRKITVLLRLSTPTWAASSPVWYFSGL